MAPDSDSPASDSPAPDSPDADGSDSENLESEGSGLDGSDPEGSDSEVLDSEGLAVEGALQAWRTPVLLAVAVVVADQLSKHWAVNRLSGNRTIDLIGSLRFNLAFNNGMAFSQGEGLGPLIAVVATLVIVWLLVSLRTVGGRLNAFGIGCVIGGAAGNLVDRAFRQDAWLRGAVVDFIDLQWFPIFNIADMAINVGAGSLILNALLSSRRQT